MVLAKPAGILSQGDRTGDATAIDCARDHLKSAREKATGSARKSRYSPFVVPVHRLDRPVSGALVMARSSKSASRLTEQFREGSPHKGYLAIVEGMPRYDRIFCPIWLKKDRQANRVEAQWSYFLGAREAISNLQVIARNNGHSLVALFPRTGRSHQLRATMALLELPILGDRKYGSSLTLPGFVALHSHLVVFRHPIKRERVAILAPLPPTWLVNWPWLRDLLPPQLCGAAPIK